MGPCKKCTQTETSYGSLVCVQCGIEDFSHLFDSTVAMQAYCLPLNTASYTRLKRFRKYLQRTSMEQSSASIPKETWKYLLSGSPYSHPSSIVCRLKSAPKSVKKKCYDCLPLLIKTLCPHITVPIINSSEKIRALNAFSKLDRAYSKGEPFVSYLFALEYILEHIGRADMLPFINKIQCRKRRAAYRWRLDKIFKHT